jgi:hypothetical protein
LAIFAAFASLYDYVAGLFQPGNTAEDEPCKVSETAEAMGA